MRDERQHMETGGNECPWCGALDIEGGPVDTGDGLAFQEMHCNECGAEWLDRYVLDGFVLQSKGELNRE